MKTCIIYNIVGRKLVYISKASLKLKVLFISQYSKIPKKCDIGKILLIASNKYLMLIVIFGNVFLMYT